MSAGHDDPFHHVRDSSVFELPQFVLNMLGVKEVRLPVIHLPGYDFQLTKFMVLQVVAGLLTLLVFRSLAKSIAGGKPASGAFANFWESIAIYIRDNVVRPTLGGHHDAHDDHHAHHDDTPHQPRLGHESTDHDPHPEDKHLPFVWTCFFYILFCNLLGAIPFLGSPTGNINVTGALAVTAFTMTFIVGTQALGVVGFFKNLVPPIDAPEPLKTVLTIGIFFLELFGLFIKHGVLAVRLFANIMGGHTVIGVMLGFIAAILASPYPALWWIVTPASIAGQVGIGLLELFVAFLQAYVFAFLATIFIGMGSHPH
ncbi:MAG: F0F1 ATP synthase subunit A [Planctomycetaceae bacterium]|nr:F0F1 ATP synthase subunit A [Planctomycetaceae bacterium]